MPAIHQLVFRRRRPIFSPAPGICPASSALGATRPSENTAQTMVNPLTIKAPAAPRTKLIGSKCGRRNDCRVCPGHSAASSCNSQRA
jgi:hypothetical protein